MANTYLTKQMGAGTSGQKFTFSAWIKRSGLTQAQLWESYHASNYRISLYIHSDNVLSLYAESGASVIGQHKSTRVLRDTNAYYHIVYAVDTTQATSTNREKFYINGELIPDSEMTGTNTYYTQNLSLPIGTSSYNHVIGRYSGDNNYFDGYMSHVHFTDGYTYDASAFGSTDATTGEWQINTSPNVTYGNNGFFILKDGNSVTDQSGEGNNFTVGGGTLTNTEDSPSNNWVTFNPLCNSGSGQVSYSRANTRGGTGGGASFLSMMPTRGKWFMEFNMNAAGAGQDNGIGFWSVDEAQRIAFYASGFKGIVWKYAGNVYVNGSNNAFSSSTFTSGDIISVAMDMDNSTATFYKNGSVATNLNAYSFPFTERQAITVGIIDGASSGAEDGIFDFNSGANPTFGGRKTAGGNADGNSQGNFSMAVPSGYYALNTKNLNAYG